MTFWKVLVSAVCTCPMVSKKNEDEIIAEALGVSENLMDVRALLHRNEGTPRDLLEAIAAAQNIPLEKLMTFEGRPLRQLYTDGFCGGAVIPLDRIDAPADDVHVSFGPPVSNGGSVISWRRCTIGTGCEWWQRCRAI